MVIAMDQRFREDENELPYLLWQKRDDKRPKTSGKPKSSAKNLDEVLNSLYISSSQRAVLKNKLTSFLNAKDCTGLTVEDFFDGCVFRIKRENEYITTTDEFEYSADLNLRRIFIDCFSSHNHDRLLASPDFKRMIEATGLEFIECSGGYESEFSMRDDEFTLKDEIVVWVYLRAGSVKRQYKLDLDKMKLSDNYYESDL